MTLGIKIQCTRPIDREALADEKNQRLASNKNVKLPLTLSYYVIIPFMKAMREKTIASEHVLNDAITGSHRKILIIN